MKQDFDYKDKIFFEISSFFNLRIFKVKTFLDLEYLNFY